MKTTNPIYTGLPTTIFEVMSRVAKEHGAINLGQGFPDVDGPEDIRRFAAEEIIAGAEPVSADDGGAGTAPGGRRRRTGASTVSTSTGRREVLVTSGATEALSRLHGRR